MNCFISEIEIENFKGIKKTTLKLNDTLNCLIGMNESGKSTILDAMDWLLNDNNESKLYQPYPNGKEYTTSVTATLCLKEKKSISWTPLFDGKKGKKLTFDLPSSTTVKIKKEVNIENRDEARNNYIFHYEDKKPALHKQSEWNLEILDLFREDIIRLLPEDLTLDENDSKYYSVIKNPIDGKSFFRMGDECVSVGLIPFLHKCLPTGTAPPNFFKDEDLVLFFAISASVLSSTIIPKDSRITDVTNMEDLWRDFFRFINIDLSSEIPDGFNSLKAPKLTSANDSFKKAYCPPDHTSEQGVKFYVECWGANGVEILFSDLEDKLTLFQHRSDGFQWYFSFYIKLLMLTKSGAEKGKLLLIDEPALSLSPKNQTMFLKWLVELCTENNIQVIYTTHSPYLVNIDNLEQIFIASKTQKDDIRISSLKDLNSSYKLSGGLLPLEHALGWRIHPSLDVPCFLLVEGIKDYVFWKALFAYFKNLKVLVIPCGSVRKISNEYLHLRGFYPDQKILICIDNDKAGKDVKKDFLNNVIAKGSKPTKEDQEMLKEVFFTYADLPSDDLKVIDLEDYIKSLCPKLKKDGKKTLAYKFKQEIEKPNNDISNIQQIESFLKEKYDSVTF